MLLVRTHAEARAAARINHSAVVTVHDVLDHDNRPWIVMELVEGNSLADEVKEKGASNRPRRRGSGCGYCAPCAPRTPPACCTVT